MTDSSLFMVAAVQTVSSPAPQQNIDTVRRLVAQAVERGAALVLLPEYWPMMGLHESDKVDIAEADGQGPVQDFMAGLAREHGIWLIGGTIPLRAAQAGKVMNTMLVYDPRGERVCRYDKIHLFGFQKGEESYDESRTIVPGADVMTFEAPFGRVGLSVCYDLRFPELFRAMGACSLMVVPAAFTYTTGRAHWELLLRARAVENQCYVLAAAQGGLHENGRRTWGQSILIDPWGKIVAELAEGEGVVVGQIDADVLAGVRESLPALRHRTM
jgi:predicted amidohydrolase